MKDRIAVSTCFIGSTRYDNRHKPNRKVDIFLNYLKENGIAIEFICPEQLGGLPTPRKPAEIRGDRVINSVGEDVTENFVRGADNSLRIMEFLDIKLALLKDRSPSCSSREIYDGSFSNQLIDGQGITTKVFREKGIMVFGEEDLDRPDFLRDYLNIDIEELKRLLNVK